MSGSCFGVTGNPKRGNKLDAAELCLPFLVFLWCWPGTLFVLLAQSGMTQVVGNEPEGDSLKGSHGELGLSGSFHVSFPSYRTNK